ncbi:glycerophosphodiester phosphodiesterase [Clostridium gasigenes]|uniref:glycerophosphodiester phosphodiesterase n=1 Tax=Clostridium gasigenes TaxID=94869 RepID=UPI0016239C76|nr:glycerophosphodiester phosphodiesterase [Clostridium gasigenes]MBB6621954.1 glycerophosphodiester phosphodiesterase [Clostridium gasigenes]
MIVFAHRGASSDYPENTILAFEKAIEIGATGLELDVHKSRDNKLVIIHDEDIERTFKGKGQVCNFTLKELRKFKNRKVMFSENSKCGIPTLEEVLELIKDEIEIVLNIELKTDVISYNEIEDDVIKLVEKYNMENRIILSSFNHESIRKCKQINHNIKTGMLYYEVCDAIKIAKKINADAIHPNAQLVTKELIEECHKNNIKVNSYTVNSPIAMRKFVEWNIDGMFTDSPELLLEVVE